MTGPLWKQLGVLGQSRKAGSPTYEQKILANVPGVLAYWPLTPDKFSEGAGGVLDVSGNGYHGTNNGATEDAADGASAAMGRAPSFNGTSSYINVFSASLNTAFNKNEHTLAIWLKVSAAGDWADATNRIAVSASVSGGTSGLTDCFKSATSNRLTGETFGAATGGGRNLTISSLLWMSVILTVSGTTGRFYVDNAQVLTDITHGTWVAAMTNFEIGVRVTSFYWKGYLAHCVVLDHAATDAERALLASSSGT